MFPFASAAMPSDILVAPPGAGSGMNAHTFPSLALPTRMPRCQPGLWPYPSLSVDSESVTYMTSFLSMKMPLGRPNCFHSSRKLPSWSKIWMRLLARSPTNRRPFESKARQCGTSNWPGPYPYLPHCLIAFLSLENFSTRALPRPGLWPSETNMSPLGAIATAFGWLNVSGPSAATPALPSVIKIFPLGVQWNTWWPFPLAPCPSVNQIVPSFSIQMPWGKTNMLAPKLLSNLPDGSNSSTGGRSDLAQEFAPHRSATQIWPLGATHTALVDPMVRPSGSVNQCSTVRYGLGSELGCAQAVPAKTRNSAIPGFNGSLQ